MNVPTMDSPSGRGELRGHDHDHSGNLFTVSIWLTSFSFSIFSKIKEKGIYKFPMPPYGEREMRKPTTILKSSLFALGLTGRTVPGPPEPPEVPTTAWTRAAGVLMRACALRGLLVITGLGLLGLPSSPSSAGTVWAWGYNQFGQLGNNSTANYAFPVQVKGRGGVGVLSGITAIAAGERHSLAVDSTGATWAGGTNLSGQLGDGTRTDRHVPVRVVGLAGVI